MALSRRNLFRKGAAAAAVAVAAPIVRHSDLMALDSPDKAEDFAQIPVYSLDTARRSPAVCPTCLAPAAAIAQMVNYDAYVMRCNRSHTWKVDGRTIVQLPRWMYDEWVGAVNMAKVMPPDRAVADIARGTVDAAAYARERGL